MARVQQKITRSTAGLRNVAFDTLERYLNGEVDGQHVKAGDPLIELGDVSVNADRTRLTQRLLSERAGLARLEAEQSRRATLVYAPDLVAAVVDQKQLLGRGEHRRP